MDCYGFAGNILYVDLSTRETQTKPLDPSLVNMFLGGRGINIKLASELIRSDIDPFSPDNIVVIGAGPFSGTTIPGCSELVVTTKFPLNGVFATASAECNSTWWGRGAAAPSRTASCWPRSSEHSSTAI